MLCDVMLCYTMLCCVMLCYTILCYAILCDVMSCCTILCYAVRCHAILCYTMLYCVMLCYAILCYAVWCCSVWLQPLRQFRFCCVVYDIVRVLFYSICICDFEPCHTSFTYLSSNKCLHGNCYYSSVSMTLRHLQRKDLFWLSQLPSTIVWSSSQRRHAVISAYIGRSREVNRDYQIVLKVELGS